MNGTNSKIIINSVPHSGNNLVGSLLASLGYQRAKKRSLFLKKEAFSLNWKTSESSLNKKIPLSDNRRVNVSIGSPNPVYLWYIKYLLGKVKKNDYIITHIPYSDELKNVLLFREFKGIYILRDPRDVCSSMLRHISTRPRHLSYNYLFTELSSDRERLDAIIYGFTDPNTGRGLVGIKGMLANSLNWIYQRNFKLIFFEDLVGPKGGGDINKQAESIKEIINHISPDINLSDEEVLNLSEKYFGSSETFRSGKVMSWKDTLTEDQADNIINLTKPILKSLPRQRYI